MSREERDWETIGTRRLLDTMPCPRCRRPVTEIDMQVRSFIPLRDWVDGGQHENNGEVRTLLRPCGHWTVTGEISVDIGDGEHLELEGSRARLAPADERGLTP